MKRNPLKLLWLLLGLLCLALGTVGVALPIITLPCPFIWRQCSALPKALKSCTPGFWEQSCIRRTWRASCGSGL